MTPALPHRWMHPTPPRRPGPVTRWVRWWGRRSRPWSPGTNIFLAYVTATLAKYIWPSSEARGAQTLVLLVWLGWLIWEVLAPIRVAVKLIREGWQPGDERDRPHDPA